MRAISRDLESSIETLPLNAIDGGHMVFPYKVFGRVNARAAHSRTEPDAVLKLTLDADQGAIWRFPDDSAIIRRRRIPMNAADVMTADVVSATPDTPVPELARLMLERRISGLPVLNDGHLVGIVSEGDLVRRVETPPRYSGWLALFMSSASVAAEYIQTHGRHARDVMTTEVVTVPETMPVAEIAELLDWRRIKRVPVVDGTGRMVGIITRANLLRALASRPAGMVPQDDMRIRDALIAELSSQGWAGRPVPDNILVEEGVVHLWGRYHDPVIRRAMVVAAEAIPGVRDVVDHMDRSLEPDPMNRPNWPDPGRP
jgi:CBS domain-containing protein